MKFWQKIFLIPILLLIGISLLALVSWLKFHPASRYELSGANENRLFSIAIDSTDGTVLVKAADWPHTFFVPFTLGESNWPERYTVSEFFWSVDKTVVVFRAQERSELTPSYVAAYDFRSHKAMHRETLKESKNSFDKRITALLLDRNGSESAAIEIPAPNTGMYEEK